MDDDPTTRDLAEQQRAREATERSRAADADTSEGERAAERRADRAAFLQEKLAEQERHPDR